MSFFQTLSGGLQISNLKPFPSWLTQVTPKLALTCYLAGFQSLQFRGLMEFSARKI